MASLWVLTIFLDFEECNNSGGAHNLVQILLRLRLMLLWRRALWWWLMLGDSCILRPYARRARRRRWLIRHFNEQVGEMVAIL